MDPSSARQPLADFLNAPVQRHTLGLMYGRRRIGKSTLLYELVDERSGFYWEATRGEPAIHLARLGEALGDHLGVGKLSFETWEDAVSELLRVGAEGATPVALDEFGYLLKGEPRLDSVTLHHSILGAIANGAVTAGSIGNKLRRPVSNLAPSLNRLIAAGFVLRHEDPIRTRRPTYALADPFLQFHYAILEPHASLLRDRNPLELWTRRLSTTFDSRVRGPVFEEQARAWVRKYASSETIGAFPDYVGPSSATLEGKEYEIDVLVAADDGAAEPSDRTVIAIGEAEAGETITARHLHHLEGARASLGRRAVGAKLFLFGAEFDTAMGDVAASRHDVELVDLARLYDGE